MTPDPFPSCLVPPCFPSLLRRYTIAAAASPDDPSAPSSAHTSAHTSDHSQGRIPIARYRDSGAAGAPEGARGAPEGAPGAVERLSAELRPLPGLTLRPEEPLARSTTFRIGGPAELLVEATTERAVARVAAAAAREGVPLFVLGLGSNVLVPDEGVRGVVLRLAGELRRVRIRGRRVSAGAGAPLAQVARKAAKAGLAGLEGLSGFPSTVGGGVYMNAGAYGTEIRDVLLSARVVERDGRRRRLATADLAPAYRRTNLRESGAIVVRALFELAPGEPRALLARIDELNAKRWQALPSGVANAGSIFKNPPGDYAGRLIEACGLKGRESGGASISERHANVIVNRGGARAEDVVALMREARDAVASRFGVVLEPEVVLLGPLGERWREAAKA